MMIAILINAETKEISEIEIKSWEDIAPAIGCDLFTCVDLGNGETLYVDDEGLYNASAFIQFNGYDPLAGSGLILGTRNNGESKSTTMTVPQVKGRVKFLSIAQVRAMYA